MKTLALILFCTSVASQAAAQGLCDQQQSAQEVQRQTANGTVVSVGVFSPNVTVVVKERNWNRGDAAAREFLARHIDCATFGPNNRMQRFIYFRSDRDNNQLAVYSLTRSGNLQTGQAP